ncbi:MAG: SMP-30/gluconolactonase/LRE family protein [Kiritimatiellales bacterium]|nr:SMP-30/gluconolactonase/LRE family protein [Kiritimatiellales bacterium]
MKSYYCIIVAGLAVAVVEAMAASPGTLEPPKTIAAPYPEIGHIEQIDAAMDKLVAADAKIEILAEGFDWSEGPVWVKEGNFVLFSDIPPNRIYRWDEKNGLRLYLCPSGYTGETSRGGEVGSNGLLIDARGRLVLCQHGDRRMARMKAPVLEPAAEYETLVGQYEGKRLNSPNDAVYHPNGDLFFTDPPYGLEKNMNDPAMELDFQGVFRLDTKGKVHLVTKDLERPNGIGISPDGKTLYIANSFGKRPVWMAFDIGADGSTANGRVFFDATKLREKNRGGNDGMAIDQHGNLFATGPGGVVILTPEGKHLGTIVTTKPTSNCTFGDDGSSLYITSDMLLLRIKLKTKGAGFD